MKSYETYRKIQIPWISVLPSHWGTQRAKTMYAKINRPVLPTDDVITCFRDGVVTLRKKRRLSGFTELLKEIGYQGIKKGDLVIHVMDAFAGAVGVSDSNGKGTPVYSVCTPKDDFDNFYYAYIVREMARNGFIQSLYRGIRERSSDFRYDVFAAQMLPIPPREEQDQIVRYLDAKVSKINKLIRIKQQQIALLKEKKQAIINRAMTKGLDPNAPMKDSGVAWIGEIPEGWEVLKIKQASKVLRGKFNHRPRNDERLYGGKFPFIQTGDVAQSGKYIESYKQTLNSLGVAVSKEFPTGTLVMTIAANIGDVSILKFDACFPDSIVGFIPHRTSIEYLYFLFLAMKPELLKEAPVNTQGNLNVERIGQMLIPLPKESIQETVIQKLNLLELLHQKKNAAINKELATLTEYRTRLISDVVTGKIDVRHIPVDDADILPEMEADVTLEDELDDSDVMAEEN